MNPDTLRLFLERNPQYRARSIQPAIYTTKYTNLAAGAGLTLGKVTVGKWDFAAARCMLTATTANSDAAYTGGPFLMTLRNQATSRDLTDQPACAAALVDFVNDSVTYSGPWMYPLLVQRNGQIFLQLSNPTGTAVDVFVAFHGVNFL